MPSFTYPHGTLSLTRASPSSAAALLFQVFEAQRCSSSPDFGMWWVCHATAHVESQEKRTSEAGKGKDSKADPHFKRSPAEALQSFSKLKSRESNLWERQRIQYGQNKTGVIGF